MRLFKEVNKLERVLLLRITFVSADHDMLFVRACVDCIFLPQFANHTYDSLAARRSKVARRLCTIECGCCLKEGFL